MTNSQIRILWGGIVVLILFALFPPCHAVGSFAFRGWHFIFSTVPDIALDWTRLSLQWACAILILGGLILSQNRRDTWADSSSSALLAAYPQPRGDDWTGGADIKRLLVPLAAGVIVALVASIGASFNSTRQSLAQARREAIVSSRLSDLEHQVKPNGKESDDVSFDINRINSKVNRLETSISDLEDKLENMTRIQRASTLNR